jgi:hypothetical protein
VTAPDAFGFGMRTPEGGWIEVGEYAGRPVKWWHNPRHLLPPTWRRVVELYFRSRGGMGVGWLPEAGGVNDQPAWLLAAFNILAAEDARAQPKPEQEA